MFHFEYQKVTVFFWRTLICQYKVFYSRRFLSIAGKFMPETFPILSYNYILLKSWNGFQSSPKSFRFLIDEHVNNIMCANFIMLPILNSLLTCSLIWFFSYLFFSILSWKVIVKKMDGNIQKVLLLSWMWRRYLVFEGKKKKKVWIIPLLLLFLSKPVCE